MGPQRELDCFTESASSAAPGSIRQQLSTKTSHKKSWTATGREQVGVELCKMRSLSKAGQSSVAQEGVRDRSRVIIGIMISSAKRPCNKYLSFSSDGEVFHLGLPPEGELLTAVAQRCQVLSGSVGIDYLSCSKLLLQGCKNMSAIFPHGFQRASELFRLGKPCRHPVLELSIREETFSAVGKTPSKIGSRSSVFWRSAAS